MSDEFDPSQVCAPNQSSDNTEIVNIDPEEAQDKPMMTTITMIFMMKIFPLL